MNWLEFREFTNTTAIYPDAGLATPAEFAYVGLGLAGEVGEMWEAKTTADRFAELGDCCWYVARGFNALEQLAFEMNLHHEFIGMYPNPALPALLIGNETKKLLRDGMQEALLEKLQKLYLSSYLALQMEFDTMCHREGCGGRSLPELFDQVEAKLTKRKAQKKLHGSGDKR